MATDNQQTPALPSQEATEGAAQQQPQQTQPTQQPQPIETLPIVSQGDLIQLNEGVDYSIKVPDTNTMDKK